MPEPARLDDPKDPLVGRVIQDDLRIEELVGQGAMARVYRARQLRVERDVAIKVLHAPLLRDATLVARFQREAVVAARIRHPHVIEVFGNCGAGRFALNDTAVVLAVGATLVGGGAAVVAVPEIVYHSSREASG